MQFLKGILLWDGGEVCLAISYRMQAAIVCTEMKEAQRKFTALNLDVK
jgi:hypothetical protein